MAAASGRRRWPARTVLALAIAGLLTGGCATAYSRGREAFDAGRYAEAAGYFQEAAAAERPRVAALTALGVCQFKLGELDRAAGVLRDVVAEAPRSGEARLYLALAELMQAQDDRALEDLAAPGPLIRHPRIASAVERATEAIRGGLSASMRRFVAASLDDTAEWAHEVSEAARGGTRAALEPSWRLYRDRYVVPLPDRR